MCEPVTLTLAGIAVAGSVYSGIQARKSANANADTSEQNAQVAEMSAGAAIARGEVTAGRALMQGTQTAAKAKTQIAAAGADVQSGSAVDVQAASEAAGTLDALTAQNNAAVDAWGYRVKASQFRRQASLSRMEGDQALIGKILGGFTSGAQIAVPALKVA